MDSEAENLIRSRTILGKIVQIHGPTTLRKSAMNIRGGAGVFDRVLGTGLYKTVLEIGTYRGIAAAYMSGLCDNVITIDLVFGKIEKNGTTFDRNLFWRTFGIDNIELKLVHDNAEKADVIRSLNFDLAFIDGGKDDVAEDFDLVKHCGAVLFHDYDDRGVPSKNIVYDFVNSLPKEQVEIMDIFAFWSNR